MSGRRTLLASLALVALVASTAAGCAGRPVHRISDGVERASAYVPSPAYSEALLGVIAEESGDFTAARRHFDEALSYSGDAWLSSRRDALGRGAGIGTPRDVVSTLLARPRTDVAFADAAERVDATEVGLRAWLLEQSVKSAARDERSIATPRVARAICSLAERGHVVLGRRLARSLVERVVGPYGTTEDSWLISRLAVDAAIDDGRPAAWEAVSKRVALSPEAWSARAALAGAPAGVAHFERLWSAEPAAVGAAGRDAAVWMLTAKKLCAASRGAFDAWAQASEPEHLTRDPLYVAFARDVACHDARRLQSTASTERSKTR